MADNTFPLLMQACLTRRKSIISHRAAFAFKDETFQEASYYYRLPNKNVYDTSTFGLFYDAFARIKNAPKVKKVVIQSHCLMAEQEIKDWQLYKRLLGALICL